MPGFSTGSWGMFEKPESLASLVSRLIASKQWRVRDQRKSFNSRDSRKPFAMMTVPVPHSPRPVLSPIDAAAGRQVRVGEWIPMSCLDMGRGGETNVCGLHCTSVDQTHCMN